MNNIWIATDWHLWNTEYDDGRHKFKSITRLGQLADEYTSVIGTNDLFIHLGDLCDPSNTKPEKLKAIIQSIPGTKILCRGNHDTEPDEYYLAAGFDHVCEILVIHDLVFSHKPVNVGVDQINIHGHLHTRKLSTLDSRYLNAYDVNYSDKPVLLEDLLQHAVQQTKADYTDTEFKQDKIDKMFDSIENDHYENILNLSEEFDLEQQLIQENETYRQMLKDNSIDTGINIHDLMEASIAPMLHSLSATEIEKDDRLDEVIYSNEEDEELTESYTKIRNINGSNYIEIDTSFIPSEIKASNVSSAVIMAKDILDEMMNTAPEMLLDIELDTIKTSEDLVHALAETMNIAYTNEPNRRYDNFNVGITSIFSLVLNTGVNNEADIVKILGDIIPQENLKDAIDRTLAELDALEHITSAMILSNVKRIGIDLGIRKNRINTVKELLKKSDKIIKTVTDRNNTIQAYEYDYRPYNIDCRVFISGDSFIKPKMVSSEVDIDPARLYSRATKYDYIIVSHGIDDNDPRFTIQPIVINGTRYDTVEDAVYALFNIKNNPRILVLGCNEKSIKLKKKYDKFVDYADMVIISESAVAYSDNEELNALVESAKLMFKTKMKDIKRAKKQILRLLKNLNLDKYDNDLFSKNKIELIGYKSYNKLAKHQFGDITLNEVRLCDAIDVTESLFVFLGTCVYYTTILMDVFKNMNNGITITEGYSWRYRRDSLITTSGADIVFPLAGLRYSNMNECLDNYQLFKDCYYNESGLYAWMSIGENNVKLFDENDPMDEVVFEDPEDTIYWEQDDTDPKLYKEKEHMVEAVGAAIMTGMTIASGVASTAKTINDWYKKNDITEYVIFNASENKMYKCIDNTYKFEKTAEMAEKQVDKTFVFLRTSNNLDKKQTERYNTARKYWSKVKSEHKKATKNESVTIDEAVLKSEPDIYYNKEKFDSGEINLCFITGHSGSGKSTMAQGMESKNIETYELDDVNNVSAFSDDNLKEYGDLIYSYFKGPGKKYRVPYQGFTDEWFEENGFGKISSDAKYYGENVNDFVHYAMKYAKSHTNKKFIIEGLQLFCYCNAKDFTNYAVYIKGTSAAKSFFRSLKRDVNYEEGLKAKTQAAYWKIMAAKNYVRHEKTIDAWRDYFSKQMESMNESTVKSNIDKDHQQKGRKSLSEFKEVTMTADQIAKYKDDNKMLKHILPDDGKDVNNNKKHFACVGWMDGNNLAAIVSVRYPTSNSRDDYNWIQALEVIEDYRGYGLSAQVLDYAVKKLHGNALAVHNDNEVAHKLYLKYGFKDGESNDVNTKMYLGSINETILYTTDPVDIYDYKYEVLEEATKGSDILYPVYIILTNSGHASISFNAELKTMYTFGMKQEDNTGFGFDVKSINDNHDDNTLYSVYCVFVNQAQLKKLKDRVQYFVKHETDFLFDYPGIELTDTNLSANPKHRWFCSRFVADILNAGSSNKKNQYIKDASYMGPNNFTQTNFAHYICGGSIKNFKSSNIEAQTLRALEQEKNERILRDKKPLNIVQGLQEAASTLSPATRDDMNKLNAKWDLRPIGYGDRDKYIAEEEEKLKRMKEHDRKIKEMKDRNKQRIKAEKQAKKARKLKVKNEEVHDPFNVLDQERFFDWNDYHNTVLGESVYGIAQKNGINRAKESIKMQIDSQDNYKNGGAGVIKNLEDTISHYEKVLDAMEKCEQHPDFKGPYSELPRPFNMMLDLNGVYKNNLTKRDVDNYINWCKQTALPESKRKYEKWKSVNEAAFKLELEDKNFQFLMDMNESATGNNKLVPVFVILTHSHSAVSKLVQATTGDEYTHASISFDSSLTHMYTFGRTSDSSVLKGSFKIEDISSAYYQNHTPPIPYSLFCIPVTEAQKKKMEKKVNYFAKNKNKFHFDFFGLFVNAMGIPNNPKNRYFCSRFVSVILNAGDPKNPLVSEPSLQRPYSFAGDDYVRFVCSGENIALYDQVVADRIIKDIMRTEKLLRAQKSRVKNENFLGINSSDPFASDVLHYKFAMLDESGMDNFMRYLSSFKIQFDKEGNVIISRKEYDQLDKHFRESVRLCKTYSEAGNAEGIKEELAKVHYMVQLINKYYLSPNANKNPRMKSDIKKDMLDLRSVMLNHFNTYMKWITIREPQFNFQAYYDTSKYGNTNMVPAKVLTAVGKVLVTAL